MQQSIPGLYVPAFYDVTYNEDGTIASFEPNNVHAKRTIEKQMVLDITNTYYPGETGRAIYQSDTGPCCTGDSKRLYSRMSFLSGGYALSPDA